MEILNVKIRQDEEGKMLCLTDLYKASIVSSASSGENPKRFDNILKNSIDRIFFILSHNKTFKITLSEFKKTIQENGVINILKRINAFKTIGTRENKVLYCTPFIFLLCAYELNDKIYNSCKQWKCFDNNSIKNRIEAGSFEINFSESLISLNVKDYKAISILINYILFGKDTSLIRNRLTRKELSDYQKMQHFFSNCIDLELVESETDLIRIMKLYYVKFKQKI